jgi:precorrin-2 dehydrogenase / sirohydrochlorin ferrochelatase
MSAAPLFPMFLKLAERTCLVAGAGCIGEPKIRSLVECGAIVRVVAPTATAAVADAETRGELLWSRKPFEVGDLDGVFLVVAATSSVEVNHFIYQEAQRRGILCNVVDDPPHCDFFYPAVVRRGQFQIAISTGGLSPALAQRVRKQLEYEFPSVYGDWLEHLGRERAALFHDVGDPELRRSLIHESVTPEALTQFTRDQFQEAGKDLL